MKSICYVSVLFFTAFLGLFPIVHAQPVASIDGFPGFFENKGQIRDQNGTPNDAVRFLYSAGNSRLQLLRTGFSYEMLKREMVPARGIAERHSVLPGDVSDPDAMETKILSHRVDIEFVGSNPNPQMLAEVKSEAYWNYILPDAPAEGYTGVYKYTRIVYRNMYPEIDLVFEVDGGAGGADLFESTVKYSFIVRPGGDPRSIKLAFRGQNALSIRNSGVYIETTNGEIAEGAPYTYSLREGSEYGTDPQGAAVKCEAVVSGDTLRFLVGSYDKRRTLVIDPSIAWCTYYGGGGLDRGYGEGIFSNNDIAITGRTSSGSNIATAGAFQTVYYSDDGYIARFTSDLHLVWGTYYGGGPLDTGRDLEVSPADEVYMAGITATSGMGTPGVHQPSFAGSWDAFLTKFSGNGARHWSTYFGGSETEWVGFGLTLSGANIVVVGRTESGGGIATPGVHQTTHSGGEDGYIAVFNGNGLLQWASYFGGAYADYAIDAIADAGGSIYITGETRSIGLATPGAFQTTPGGGLDSYVAKFSATGQLLWSTYIGGAGNDAGFAVALAGTDILTTGETTSSTNIASPGAFQTVLKSAKDSYLMKFSASGARQWSTYFGGEADDRGNAMYAAGSKIFFTGITSSNTGIATPGAIQSVNKGGGDVFFTEFDLNGQMMYGTYFGGANQDIGYDVTFDFGSNIVVIGETSSPGLATPGTHQTVLQGTGDAFILKIKVDVTFVPSVYAGDDQVICFGDTVDLRPVITQPGTPPYTYSWSPANLVTHPDSLWTTAIPHSTTVFVITVRDSANTVFTDTIRIVVSPPLIVEAGPDKSVCSGGTAQLEGSYSGGTLPMTVLWQPSTGLSSTATLQTTATVDTTTRYVLCVTDSAGCTSCDSMTVYVRNIEVQASADTTICAGDAAELSVSVNNASPPITCTWSPDSTLSSPTGTHVTAHPGSTTTYIVSVVDSAGCSGTDTVTVVVRPPVVVDAGKDTAICAGGIVVLNGTVQTAAMPISVKWEPSASVSSPSSLSANAYPLQSTTYRLLVTDSAGCIGTDSVFVRVFDLPTVDAGPDLLVCPGAGVQLQATTGVGDTIVAYSWYPGSGLSDSTIANPVASPVSRIRYFVTVTDIHGCSAKDSVLIEIGNALKVDAGNDVSFCTGGSADIGRSVSGGTPPYTCTWSPAMGLSDPGALNTGAKPAVTTTYILNVADSTGCAGSDTVTVSVIDKLSVDGGEDKRICAGKSVVIGKNPTAGAPPFLISWQPAAGLSNPSSATPTASPRTTTTYIVSIIDKNGCSGTDTVTVFVSSEILATAGPGKSICKGTSTRLEGGAVGGIPPYTFSWSPAMGLSSTKVARPEVNILASTTYILTVTDSLGCVDSDTVTVLVGSGLQVNAGNDIYWCSGAGVQLTARYSGGVAPYTITWSPPDGLSSTTADVVTASPQTTTTYIVTVSDQSGCTGRDTVTIHSNEPVQFDAGPDIVICGRDSASIGRPATWGTPPYTYHWTPVTGIGNPDTVPATVFPASTTSYIVTATDNNGCVASDTILASVFDSPVVDAGDDAVVCIGDTIQLLAQVTGGTGPFTYSWTPPEWLTNSSVPNPLAFPGVRTVFVVGVTDANGCSSADTVVIVAAAAPLVDIYPSVDSTICEGDSIVLRADGNSQYYVWSTGDTASSIVVRESGVYDVKGITMRGCWAMAGGVRVTVLPAPAVHIQGPVQLCSRDSIMYHAVPSGLGGYTWTITGGVITQGNGTDRITVSWAGGATSGIVEVVAGSAPCAGKDTVLVELGDALRPAILWDGNLHLCANETLIFSALPGYRSYRWSTGDTGRSITVGRPGAYYLWAVDSSGCSGYSDTLTVTASHNSPVAITGNMVLCGDAPVELIAAQGFISYQWTTGDTTRTTTVAEPGLYTVYAIDSSGCSSSAEVTVLKGTPPAITITGDTLLCSGETGLLSTDVPCWSYHWSTGGTSRSIQVTQPGLYWVVVGDEAGCTYADSVYVHDSPATDILVEASDIHAGPGETVFLTVGIVGSIDALILANAAYSGILSFQRSVLYPVNAPYTDTGDMRYVPFSGVYNGSGGTLAHIECLATLGQTDTSAVQIKQFTFGIPCPSIRIDPGMVEIRICREGGKRLVGSNRQVSVSVAPNPFELTTRITYRLPYESHVLLLIKDALGREVAQLTDGMQMPGIHTAEFQADRLPSGIYYYYLQTGREQITGKMWRVK